MAHVQYQPNEVFRWFDGTRIKETIDLTGPACPRAIEGLRSPEFRLHRLDDGRIILGVKIDRGERLVKELQKSFRVSEIYGIDLTDQTKSLWPVLNRWTTQP